MKKQIVPTLSAFDELIKDKIQIILTYPNNDAGGMVLLLKEWSKNKDNVFLYKSLGRYYYHGLLNLIIKKIKLVCVGNSSSVLKKLLLLVVPQ